MLLYEGLHAACTTSSNTSKAVVTNSADGSELADSVTAASSVSVRRAACGWSRGVTSTRSDSTRSARDRCCANTVLLAAPVAVTLEVALAAASSALMAATVLARPA